MRNKSHSGSVSPRDKRRNHDDGSHRSSRSPAKSSYDSRRNRSPRDDYETKRRSRDKQYYRRSNQRDRSPRDRMPYRRERSPKRYSPREGYGQRRRYSPRNRSPRRDRRDRRDDQKIMESKKLFITNIDGHIPADEVKQDLQKQFEVFGEIKEIIIKSKTHSSNTYAFIQYFQISSAIDAEARMKSKDFKGKELKVQFGKGERRMEDRHPGQCYNCHRDGHYARQCTQRRREKPRYPDDRYRSRSRSHSRSRKHHHRRHSISSSQSRGSYRRKRSYSRDYERSKRDDGRRDRSPRYSRRNY